MRITRTLLAALAVLLLCAAAQGSPAMASIARPSAISDVSSCSVMYSVGHKSGGNETWSYFGSDANLYFYGGSVPRTTLCFIPEGVDGDNPVGFIQDYNNGGCLTTNPMETRVYEVTCYSTADEDWELDISNDSGSKYVISVENADIGGCLYEDTQEPSIMASCSANYTDKFEWFYWPITYTA
jgi:hypothetical protein